MVHICARSALVDSHLTLTAREQEIVRYIAAGAQNDWIAYVMGISANTVKTHVGNILRKFGLHNRTQIAMLLTSHLVIPAPAPPPRALAVRAEGLWAAAPAGQPLP